MIKKTHYILLLTLIFFYSCSIPKNISKNQDYLSKVEMKAKKESTNQLVDFFNAENARLLGKYSEALHLYNEFVKKYPQNATAKYNLSKLCFQNKNAQAAETFAQKAVEINPANNYFQEYYTFLLLYNYKFKNAEKQYNSLIEKNPSNPDYVFKKAQLFLKTKEYAKALDCLNEYEKIVGFNEDIINQKKNLYIILNKPDLAILEIKKLQKEYPSNVAYPLLIAEIYVSEKNTVGAEITFKEIENKYGTDPTAQAALAEYYLSKKDEKAYNDFMLKLMQNKNVSTETKISIILPTLKKLDEDSIANDNHIIELVKSISLAAPTDKDAILIYANVLTYSKKTILAIVQYKRYLTIDSSNFDVWIQVASLYFDEKMYDSTIVISEIASKLFYDKALPYFYKGLAYVQKNEQEKAIESLTIALKKDASNNALAALIHTSLGDAYNSLKQYKQSDESFDAALKLFPLDATTLNNYAYYLSVRNERLTDAEAMSKKSLELQPNSKSFLDTYGWILFQQGKFEEAKKYIEKAIQSNGEEDGTLFEHLGDVYFKLNDLLNAKKYWQMAKDKGEDNSILINKIKSGKINE
jgi:tetratricopeptide (TPR) repeat protein